MSGHRDQKYSTTKTKGKGGYSTHTRSGVSHSEGRGTGVFGTTLGRRQPGMNQRATTGKPFVGKGRRSRKKK